MSKALAAGIILEAASNTANKKTRIFFFIEIRSTLIIVKLIVF